MIMENCVTKMYQSTPLLIFKEDLEHKNGDSLRQENERNILEETNENIHMEINPYASVKSYLKCQDFNKSNEKPMKLHDKTVCKSSNMKSVDVCENDKVFMLDNNGDTYSSFENSIFVIDGRTYRLIRDPDLIFEDVSLGNKINPSKSRKKNDGINVNKDKDFYNINDDNNCQCICVTCRAPCKYCNNNMVTSSTDTHDFDNYLLSFNIKLVPESKCKNVCVDTCDLDSHFDFYKNNQEKICKDVSTDCKDLVNEKTIFKPRMKSKCVDTYDLSENNVCKSEDETTDIENDFLIDNLNNSWTCEATLTTQDDFNVVKKEIFDVEETQSDEEIENVEVIENESEHDKSKTYDVSSDDSDIDLKTTKQLIKCKKLSKVHKLLIMKVMKGDNGFFVCFFCNEEFDKRHLAVLHLQKHIDGDDYRCTNCDKLFHSHLVMKKHLTLNNCNAKASEGEKNNSDSQDGQKIKKGSCESKEMTNFKTVVKKKSRVKNEYVCLSCGKQFRSNIALSDHKCVHTGQKNFLCELCNKYFTTKANLKTHKLTHTGSKNFKCTACDKVFHKKDSLKVHLRKHSGEKPFPCDLCPMKFDRNYILKNHRLRHFDERSFICSTCGKAFTTNGGLNNHEKSHKKDPSTRPSRKPSEKPTLDTANAVICDVCGKVYSTKSNLRMHKQVHLGLKPYKCPVCHHLYAKKDSMRTHMRTHTDERPFSCDVCGMTFFRNHTLKTHKLRHTGERPYRCTSCGKTFTQSSSLSYHLKHHERVEKNKEYSNDESMKLPRKKRYSSALKQATSPPKKYLKNTKYSIKNDEQNLDKVKEDLFIKNKYENDHKTYSLYVSGTKQVNKLSTNKTTTSNENQIVCNNDYEVFDINKEQSTIYDTINIVPPNKVNCFVTKHGNVLTVTKQNKRTHKSVTDSLFTDIKKDISGENLIISKNSYITKDGNLVIGNKLSDNKNDEYIEVVQENKVKDELSTIEIPANSEIFSTSVISEADSVQFTIHNVNDNVLLNPVFPVATFRPKITKIVNRPQLDTTGNLVTKSISDLELKHKLKQKTFTQDLTKNINIAFINEKSTRENTDCNIITVNKPISDCENDNFTENHDIIVSDVIDLKDANMISGTILDPAKLDLQSVGGVQFCIV